jgi:hypothetical protein
MLSILCILLIATASIQMTEARPEPSTEVLQHFSARKADFQEPEVISENQVDPETFMGVNLMDKMVHLSQAPVEATRRDAEILKSRRASYMRMCSFKICPLGKRD